MRYENKTEGRTRSKGEGKRDNGTKGKPKRESSLNIRLDAQRHLWTLVLATLDISLSDSRDVRPGHIISRHRRRKLESPDQGIKHGFDSVRGGVRSRQSEAYSRSRIIHLLVNSELKPDTSPGATHERHLVPPDTRGFHGGIGGKPPSVRTAKRPNNKLAESVNLELHVLEFPSVFPPNILRRVHRVDWYPNLITFVQFHDPPISQRDQYILHGDPL